MTVKLTDFNIKLFDELDSTNDYAKMEFNNLEKPFIISTGFQKKGRGQHSNIWNSKKNKNILISYGFMPKEIEAADQFLISKIISISIIELLSEYIDNEEDIKVKWPNDIFYKNKKIAGILIENTINGNNLTSSICGIGININQCEFGDIETAISLKSIINENVNLEYALVRLINIISKNLENYENNELFDENYRAKMLFIDKARRYIYKGKNIEATIEGVDRFGRLIIRYGSCEIVCNHGQIDFNL